MKRFLLGFSSAVLLMGCAGFSYHYYGIADVIYDHGKLLGPTPNEDLPFSKCAPNGESLNPCVVMFTKDFMAFKLDYDDTKQKLIDCQRGIK